MGTRRKKSLDIELLRELQMDDNVELTFLLEARAKKGPEEVAKVFCRDQKNYKNKALIEVFRPKPEEVVMTVRILSHKEGSEFVRSLPLDVRKNYDTYLTKDKQGMKYLGELAKGIGF